MLQNVPLFFQPSLCFFHRWRFRADYAPETRRVVGFNEVSEFVHNHIVNYEHWRFYETPVEIDVAVHRAGAPPISNINDPGRRELYSQLPCVECWTWKNCFLSARNVPIPQHCAALGLMRPRDEEEFGELDLTACCFSDFNPVKRELSVTLPVDEKKITFETTDLAKHAAYTGPWRFIDVARSITRVLVDAHEDLNDALQYRLIQDLSAL